MGNSITSISFLKDADTIQMKGNTQIAAKRPKVIKYNSKEPEAAARYAKIAKFINLPGTTDEELVDALIARIREMNKALDIPTCIKYYEGGIIDEKEFLEKLPKVAELAVGDACTGSNPRSITPDVMAKLLKCCYYDEEVDF